MTTEAPAVAPSTLFVLEAVGRSGETTWSVKPGMDSALREADALTNTGAAVTVWTYVPKHSIFRSRS